MDDYKIAGHQVIERWVSSSMPEPNTQVFFRAVGDPDKPHLVYFEGGPGGTLPRPIPNNPILKLAEKYRLIFIDSRGTGLSTPVNENTFSALNEIEQIKLLRTHRADTLVEDAELVRKSLLGDERWTLLGQSYGGFCAFTYLSKYPDGLLEVFITNGTPSLTKSVEDVYEAIVKKLESRINKFLKLPDMKMRISEIESHLAGTPEYLLDGQRFNLRKFQQLGFKMDSQAGRASLFFMFKDAFYTDRGTKRLTPYFLEAAAQTLRVFERPIYTSMHESIYSQGTPTQWSGQRVFEASGLPFSSEIMFDWMFDDYKGLEPFKSAARLIARKDDWSPLYNLDVLKKNKVPVAALIGFNDLYVPATLSIETAKIVTGMNYWVDSETEHGELLKNPLETVDKLKALNDTI